MSAPSAVQTPSRPKMDTKTMVSIAMLTGIAYIVMLLSKLMPSVMFFGLRLQGRGGLHRRLHLRPLRRRHHLYPGGLHRDAHHQPHRPHWLYHECPGHLAPSLATACFIYKKVHSKKGAVLGLACGVACLVAVMLLWNYLITPLYMTGYSRADVAGLLPTLFLPFNLAKGGMNMAATLLLYPPVVSAMRRAGVVPSSQSTQEKRINAGFVLFALSLLATFVVFALVLAGVI